MAACDALAQEADEARERAEEAATATKDEVEEAFDDTGLALTACGSAAGGFAAGIAIGVGALPGCLTTAWKAVTSWCDARESAKSTAQAAEEAAAAQAAYLACLSDHKKR